MRSVDIVLNLLGETADFLIENCETRHWLYRFLGNKK